MSARSARSARSGRNSKIYKFGQFTVYNYTTIQAFVTYLRKGNINITILINILYSYDTAHNCKNNCLVKQPYFLRIVHINSCV